MQHFFSSLCSPFPVLGPFHSILYLGPCCFTIIDGRMVPIFCRDPNDKKHRGKAAEEGDPIEILTSVSSADRRVGRAAGLDPGRVGIFQGYTYRGIRE